MNRYREACEYALSFAKRQGADMAQCVSGERATEEFNIDGGEFSLLRTVFSNSFQIKVLKGGRKGVSAVGSLTKESVERAVSDALTAADSADPDECEGIAEAAPPEVFSTGQMESSRDLFFERLREFQAGVREEFPQIMLEQVIAAHKAGRTAFLNSNGVDFEYHSGFYDIGATFSAQEGGLTSSFNGYGVRRCDLDDPILRMGQFHQLLDESVRQIRTRSVDGKFQGPVILTPGCLFEFLATAISNFASDSPLIEGTSIWKDALGSAVGSPKITLSSVPLDARIACGERFTPDGYKSEDATLIENGVLRSFFLSRYGAKKTGLPRTKTLGMNLLLHPGDTPLPDLIQSIDSGLLVGRFSGGQPGANGDFSGIAKNSFLIEKGKITDAVSETMISGNIADMLKHVIAVTDTLEPDGASLMPYAAFDGVTISGK